jgi:hypothetical protein
MVVKTDFHTKCIGLMALVGWTYGKPLQLSWPVGRAVNTLDNPRRVNARVRSGPGHIQKMWIKVGLSDETKNRGTWVSMSGQEKDPTQVDSSLEHWTPYLQQKSNRVYTTLCIQMALTW